MTPITPRRAWSTGVFAFALALFFGLAHCTTPTPAPAAADAGVRLGANSLTPADSGIPHIRGGQMQAAASPVDIRSTTDFAPPAPTAAGYYALVIDDAGDASWPQLTTDLINALPAAFAPSLSFASGSGSYELSQPATPTYNANPATSSGTVTGCLIADNQGHSASAIAHANPINVDTPAGPHSYALTSAGTVTVTVTETLIATSTTKSASASLSFFPRGGWHGVDSHAGGVTITASGNNVALGGGSASATLTGSSLANSFVGTTFTENATGGFYIYAAYPHTGSAHTFTASAAPFPMSVVVPSFAFTNQWGQTSIPIDLYRSDNLLNTTFVVTVAQ